MSFINLILCIILPVFIIYFSVILNPAPNREYQINEYLKLKLENGRTNIYVKNKIFRQCMYLLLNIPVNKVRDYEEIDSIDEAAEHLDRSMEGVRTGGSRITPEVEFWGHCSNIKAWAENGYDTRILHRNLAFPLLRRLTNVGDPQAKKVFKEEIALRLASKHPTVINYLIQENYLKYLSAEELESIFDEIDFSFLNSYIRNLKTMLNTMQQQSLLNSTQIYDHRIISLFHTIFSRFHTRHIPLLFSKIKSELPEKYQQKLTLLIFSAYKDKMLFPKIKFINNNIEDFDLDEYDFVEYNSRIIGILDKEKLILRDKKIENIDEIEGINNSIATIHELDLSDNMITDLDGLEQFENIKILKLDNNQIKDLSILHKFSSLEELSVRNNKISKIEEIENLVNLKRINLSGNNDLKSIPEVLVKLPKLKICKLWNCNITVYEESTKSIFWNDQNYRYFKGYTKKDLEYYEKTHKTKAKSSLDDGLYKNYTEWVIKMHKIISKNKISYEDIEKFEEESEMNAIWSGRLTNTFRKWLFYKPQRKITEYL